MRTPSLLLTLAATAAVTDAGGTVPDPDEQLLSRVQLVQPSPTADSVATIVAPGTIAYDPRRFENVAARFGGRIERLYVRYQFQPVRAGQKLFDIYSPELVTEQQNLLFLLKSNDPDDRALLNASRQKLQLLGLTAAQVRAVEQRGRPQLSVFSSVSGYVMETGPAAAAGASGMSPPANPGGQLKIGQLVTSRIKPPATSGGLWVPATSVVDLGTRQVVFRQQPDSPRLLAVAMVTGVRRGTQVQVVRGLRPDDRIAENGQFLVDSESFINPVADAQQ